MSRAWLGLLLLLLVGCGSAPRAQDPLPSHSIDAGPQSAIGNLGSRALAGSPANDSALHVLPAGLDALAARLALIERAERSVDLQYYIFRTDTSGVGLIAALWRAAERGVRVRLLLDDWGARPDDAALQRLAAHPLMEVRLFNRLVQPQSAALSLLIDFDRTQQRMHNKLLVADSRAAIVGGRNIGDEYFQRRREFEFGDVDMLVLGKVVPQLADAFDRYWNDALATPVPPSPEPGAAPEPPSEPVTALWQAVQATGWAQRLAAGGLRWFTGPARAVQDLPGKLEPGRPAEATQLGRDIAGAMGPVHKELLIVSPYFVPGPGGVAQLRALTQRGVQVTVVTNTLAATDVPAAHAGYARYRDALLDAGVRLFEVRADALQRPRTGRAGSSRLSLHAKLLVVDRTTSFIGSMNIDPRSQRLNTENGIVVASADLAAELTDGVQQALVDDAWRVDREGQQLRWTGRQDGNPVTLDHEPGAHWWLRLQTLLLSWPAIEGLL